MTKFTDKHLKDTIRQAGDDFTLSASHKSAMRFHLMDVIKSGETRTSTRHIVNSGRFNPMPLIPIIAAIILVLGGGTASVANSAKPGDALYSVDQFIEQLQEKFTAGPEAKANLLAKLADERVVELTALENVDVTKLTETAQQLWEQHRQDAIERVNASIARINATQDKFEERLKAATDPDEQANLQKIVDHLGEVSVKRADRLTELENKTFPGLGIGQTLKQALEQARETRKQELEQIREETKNQLEQQLEAQKQAREQLREGKSEDDNESEVEDDHDSNTTSSSSTGNQSALEARVPRNPITGEIDWDYYDTDHDGIPDKWDRYPDWPPHTMKAEL